MNITKKVVGICLIMALLLPAFVSAENSTTTTNTTIQMLLQQIKDLQTRIQNLQTQQKSLQEQKQELKSDVKETAVQLIKTLRQGQSGDDVKVLQALLAADPEIYGEGIISGFFGQKTANAVRKFQKKYGFEQVGIVGPKTLKKLNELLSSDHPLKFLITSTATSTKKDKRDGDEDKGEKRELCVKVALGHLIAPGWLKKDENNKPIVPECQDIPKGIKDKMDDDDWHKKPATTTPPVVVDTTAPIISAITTSSVSATTSVITINWNTNEVATTKVYYGTVAPLSLSTALHTDLVTALTLSHSANLSNLATSTTYHYVVESKDQAGNTAVSADQTFATLAE